MGNSGNTLPHQEQWLRFGRAGTTGRFHASKTNFYNILERRWSMRGWVRLPGSLELGSLLLRYKPGNVTAQNCCGLQCFFLVALDHSQIIETGGLPVDDICGIQQVLAWTSEFFHFLELGYHVPEVLAGKLRILVDGKVPELDSQVVFLAGEPHLVMEALQFVLSVHQHSISGMNTVVRVIPVQQVIENIRALLAARLGQVVNMGADQINH